MNVLLIILFIIVGLVALVLLLALFAPKAYSLQRSVTVNRPAGEVYDYLRHLRNQDAFNKWTMTDPAMKKTYRGTDGEVGFVYAWEGNKKAGKGEQEILRLQPNKRIDLEVRFEKPFKAVAKTPFTLEPAGESQTQVTWEMNSGMPYPMNLVLTLIGVEKLLGKDLEANLANIKRELEQ